MRKRWPIVLALGSFVGCSDDASDAVPPELARIDRFFQRWSAASPLGERPDRAAILAAIDRRFPIAEGEERETELRRESATVALAVVTSYIEGSTRFQGAVLERRGGQWVVEEPPGPTEFLCAEPGVPTPRKIGALVFDRAGCSQCHPVTGETVEGPALRGVFGRERRLSDGSVVVADEDYVRRTIIEWDRPVLAGWARTMPSYAGRLREPELNGLIQYVKSLAASD